MVNKEALVNTASMFQLVDFWVKHKVLEDVQVPADFWVKHINLSLDTPVICEIMLLQFTYSRYWISTGETTLITRKYENKPEMLKKIWLVR